MVPIIEVSNEVMNTLNSKDFTRRKDLEAPKQPQIVETDTSQYIAFPEEFMKGKYANLLISPGRVAYSPEVEKAGKELGLTLRNTGKDSLDREFIGNINWTEAMKLNIAMGNRSPVLREEIDFLNLLYQGMQGKIKVYNESGKQLDNKFLENVFYDVIGVKSLWRGEWIDGDFKVKDDKLRMNSYHKLESGVLVPTKSQVLNKSTLMQDKSPGISIESLLKTANSQGLPTSKTQDGKLYYLPPMKDNISVARFIAYSNWSVLSCDGNPSDQNSVLGVRAVKQHE